jgi:hypothetical protein
MFYMNKQLENKSSDDYDINLEYMCLKLQHIIEEISVANSKEDYSASHATIKSLVHEKGFRNICALAKWTYGTSNINIILGNS